MQKIIVLIFPFYCAITVNAQWNYPATKTVDSVNNYFGKEITDHYRWMEKLSDTEVQAWFKKQGDFSKKILSNLNGRDSLFNSFMQLNKLTGDTYASFISTDSLWFYKKTKAGENVASLYYRKGPGGKEILLLNPAFLLKGHVYNIKNLLPCPDGSKLVIELAEGGGEISTIHVMNVATKKMYKDSLPETLFGVSGWLNNNAFMYTAHTSTDKDAIAYHLNSKSMLHMLGTAVTADKEIFSKSKYISISILPEDICFTVLDDERKYLLGFLATADNALKVYYAPAATATNAVIPWKVLIKKEDQVTNFGTHKNDLYLLTYKNAPHFKIIKTNIIAPDPDNASVVSNESDKTIESISVTKDQLLITQSDGINGNLLKYDFITAKMQAVAANLQGKVSVVYASNKTNIALISSASWNKPYTVYELNTTNGNNKKSIFNSEIKYPGIEDIMVKEVEVKSYDGTMVPLSILYNKKINLDGNNSCILNGYGCYGISNSPRFSMLNLAMLQRGVVMAFAHVRGGGEKGESWHKGGYKTTKPNTWKDFIACAEYLVSESYTSKAKLSGTGTSAGGILISRSITERPDLFAAAVCNVGDANALRSEYGTDGPANSKEYGTEKDSVECMALIEMDGLSHVQKNIKYPAVLCATGINDPRVAPWQPGKFAAALQNNTASGNAVLLRVDYDNGHFTEDRSVTFNNFADQFSFLLWQTGHPGFALKKQPY